MALHSSDVNKADDLRSEADKAQEEDYKSVHTGPNDSIPDPEADGKHLTADELDYSGDHASYEAKVASAGKKAADEDEKAKKDEK